MLIALGRQGYYLALTKLLCHVASHALKRLAFLTTHDGSKAQLKLPQNCIQLASSHLSLQSSSQFSQFSFFLSGTLFIHRLHFAQHSAQPILVLLLDLCQLRFMKCCNHSTIHPPPPYPQTVLHPDKLHRFDGAPDPSQPNQMAAAHQTSYLVPEVFTSCSHEFRLTFVEVLIAHPNKCLLVKAQELFTIDGPTPIFVKHLKGSIGLLIRPASSIHRDSNLVELILIKLSIEVKVKEVEGGIQTSDLILRHSFRHECGGVLELRFFRLEVGSEFRNDLICILGRSIFEPRGFIDESLKV